jgi:hypothetical protein
MTATRRKKRHLPRLTKAKLAEMIEQATLDAYGESEQITGWFTMIEENLAVPFETKVFGVPVTVERVNLDRSEQIVAVCRRGRRRQSLPIIDAVADAAAVWSGMDRSVSPLADRKPFCGSLVVSEYQYFEFQAIDRPPSAALLGPRGQRI